MKRIPLGGSGNYWTLVDDEDFECVNAFNWYVNIGRKHGIVNSVYAVRFPHVKGVRTRILLHRFLLGITERSIKVDHRNGDGLDNRRANLRQADGYENQHNARLRRDNKTGFKGVGLHHGRFVARIRVNRKCINLGSFGSAQKAAAAYDMAAIKYFGEFARPNNPLLLTAEDGKKWCHKPVTK